MNERRGNHVRLILALATMALGVWSMADTHLSAQRIGNDDAPLAVTQPALLIAKDAMPTGNVAYHSAVTYTVVLANSGLVSDTNVLLTDTLPVEVDFGRWVPGGQPAGAEVVADELTWSGIVTTGESITFTFVVSHVGDYGDTVTNIAEFSGTLQTGEDSAMFTVADQGMHTVHLPLVLKSPPFFPPFAIIYGGTNKEYANAVQQTADGGYVIVGDIESFETGDSDAWVLKLNADGSVAWQKTYGGVDFDIAYAIQQTSDGGYVVAGWTSSFGAGGVDVWVFKLDAGGNVAWQKTYGGEDRDDVQAIQQTADGGFVMAGDTSSFGGDVWVLKLNADGSVAWQKTYGGEDVDRAHAIQQTTDGGYVVAGETPLWGVGYTNAWVLKLNADGSVAWHKTYGGALYDGAHDIQQTADGSYVVAGRTWSFDVGGGDVWVLKLNADGSVAWQKTYGGADSDYAYDIRQTADGGYVVAGDTSSFGAGDYDAWVLKLNPDGSVAWQKTYGGTHGDNAESIWQTSDGGYVVAGRTASFGFDFVYGSVWMLKLDSEGTLCVGCPLGETSTATPVDSSATVANSAATVADSTAMVADSSATVTDTDVIPDPICICASSICTRAE